MKYYLGIDAGSSYIKMVLIDSAVGVLDRHIVRRGADIDKVCQDSIAGLLEKNSLDKTDVSAITATGYGRKQVSIADEIITEIMAVSIGGYRACNQAGVIIDIGGQDSKVIAIDSAGHIIDFAMNHKCAAGTGKFLEVTSASLDVDIKQLGELSQKADKDLAITSTCTVFAESEIISYVAKGHKKENIIKGLHCSIADQILGLCSQIRAISSISGGKILFVGGVALNSGVVTQLEGKLDKEVIVADYPQYAGAFGSAIYAMRMN